MVSVLLDSVKLQHHSSTACNLYPCSCSPPVARRLVSPSKLCTSQVKYSGRQCQARTRPPSLPLLAVYLNSVYRGVRELSWYRSRRAPPSSTMRTLAKIAMSVKGTPCIRKEGRSIKYLLTQLTLSVSSDRCLSGLFELRPVFPWAIATLPLLCHGFQNNAPLVSCLTVPYSHTLRLSSKPVRRASDLLARLQLLR